MNKNGYFRLIKLHIYGTEVVVFWKWRVTWKFCFMKYQSKGNFMGTGLEKSIIFGKSHTMKKYLIGDSRKISQNLI